MKKDNFLRKDEATHAFLHLKQALVSEPLLSLPHFSKNITMKTDASGKGIRVVLMQDQHPIAYISKSLGPKQQKLSYL